MLKYATAGFMDWLGGGETGAPEVAILTPQLRFYPSIKSLSFVSGLRRGKVPRSCWLWPMPYMLLPELPAAAACAAEGINKKRSLCLR